MKVFNQVPFLRLLIPLIAGILLGVYFCVELNWLWYALFALLLTLGILNQETKLFSRHRTTFWYGCILNCILIISGYQLTLLNTETNAQNHFSKFNEVTDCLAVRIYKQPIEKQNIYKLFAVVEEVQCKGSWIRTTGNIMLMFPKDSTTASIRYGDYLLIKAPIEEVSGPKNPKEFNYKKYLSYQAVYHQAYLPAGTWTMAEKKGGYKIISIAFAMQTKLLTIFKKFIPGKREFAVISALILGDTDGIDNELLYAYSGSGAIHVLSVSGLHVGLIFMALNWLLFFMERKHWMKVLKSIIIIGFLIFYSILTGLSPAVMRSAVMLSLIICGITFRKSPNILNTLAVSAFFLLIYDPFLIMNVGFLLSYFAMAGIIIFHPLIYNQIEFKNTWMDKIWSATCAALTAELLTFPLAMLFFHQFPMYFLLSNVIVIFLSTVIMFAGIGLLVFSYFVTFSLYLGKATAFVVYLLNFTVIKITALPYSVWKNISINIGETIFIYLAIIAFSLFLLGRRRGFLLSGICFLIIVFSNQLFENYSTMNQKKIIIYDIKKSSAIDLIDGHSSTFIGDQNLFSNQSLVSFHISANRGSLKVIPSEINTFQLDQSYIKTDSIIAHKNFAMNQNYIQFFDKKMLFINDSDLLEGNYKNLPIDYLVLANNVAVKIQELLKHYSFKLLIIDGSNSVYRNKKWLSECRKTNTPVYSVLSQGSLVINL